MIFLSYVSQDRDRVNPYYELLESKGFDVWIDHKRILPGQNWNYEIRTALDRADQIIIFISENSVDKRGYAQREISIALEKLEEKLLSDIYIIPILLDDVDPPNILKKLHYLKSNGRNVSAELLRSIETASSKAKSIIEHTQKESDLKWGVTDAKSSYSGIP
ncbi:toll/interleukin-1 receptor domain-containing protein, partial [Paracoccus sp. PXZ]